jgi:RNA polymerase sigma-70 factor (ECF subfamily)
MSGMWKDTDARWNALALLAQGGDRDALRELLGVVEAQRRAVRLAGVPDWDADDVLQETAAALVLHLHEYDPARPVSAWVRGIALLRTADYLRARRRHLRRVRAAETAAPLLAPPETPHEAREAREAREALRAAVDALPGPCRAALGAAAQGHEGRREVSEALGIGLRVAEKQLDKGKKLLARALRDHAPARRAA